MKYVFTPVYIHLSVFVKDLVQNLFALRVLYTVHKINFCRLDSNMSVKDPCVANVLATFELIMLNYSPKIFSNMLNRLNSDLQPQSYVQIAVFF